MLRTRGVTPILIKEKTKRTTRTKIQSLRRMPLSLVEAEGDHHLTRLAEAATGRAKKGTSH